MGYAIKYRIRPVLDGFGIYETAGHASWFNIGKPYKTKEEAEAAMRRICSKEEWFYDEKGEAV